MTFTPKPRAEKKMATSGDISDFVRANFQHYSILFERYTNPSVREVGEVGAVQSSKCQKLADFLPKLSPNVDAQELLEFLSDGIK